MHRTLAVVVVSGALALLVGCARAGDPTGTGRDAFVSMDGNVRDGGTIDTGGADTGGATDSGTCGSLGGACCPGDACTEGMCVDGSCIEVSTDGGGGDTGPRDAGRDTGIDAATLCGASAQPCCVGSTCMPGLACTGGMCGAPMPDSGVDAAPTCGGSAQPCCVGSTCLGGLACTAGVCGPPMPDAGPRDSGATGPDSGGPPCGLFPFMACCPGSICVFPGLMCVAGVCIPS